MSDSLPPMTDETLAAIEARLGAATPGPWTAHMPGGIHDDTAWVGAPHEDEGNGVFVASTSGHPDGLNDAIFIASAPADLRRLLGEVKRLNREFADFREMAVLNTRSQGEALDRARSECAALAAKVGEGEEEWAIRVVTEPGGAYSYHNYCDPENPERDLEATLRVLADGHDGYGNPVPHGPVSIVKRTVWSTEWETVEPSGMPHTPAQEAQERPETREGDTGKGTGVSEAPGTAQAIEDLNQKHWLKWNTIARTITGCQCGFGANEDSDCGFGDSVVAHLLEVGAGASRAAHYREAAVSLRRLDYHQAALLLDHVADDLDNERTRP